MTLPLNLSKVAMDLDLLIEILNCQLIASQIRCLNATEVLLLRGIWQYQTYTEIAREADYSKGYISNVVAPGLCRRLSELIGKRVTKKNCRAILENYITTHIKPNFPPQQKAQPEVLSFPHKLDSPSMATEEAASPDRFSSAPSPPYPNGPLPLDSRYYIQRPRVEAQIYEQITKPGALVRIKAPQEMGKTSLLLRVLQYAKERNYRTVNLNLQQIDRGTLNDFDRFLRWICANVSRQLDLESKLADYWDEEIGSGINDTRPKLTHLLKKTDYGILLVEHKDRLARFGTNYMQLLLEMLGVRLEIVNLAENGRDELILDFIAIINSSAQTN